MIILISYCYHFIVVILYVYRHYYTSVAGSCMWLDNESVESENRK